MLLFYLFECFVLSVAVTRPNIVVIIADDLGWNDVGFHGSNQIPTPNIDALAYSGIILQNYYVNPICTPSRSAFMTGKYPIHTGMHHGVIYGMEPRGLPLSEKLLPQYLKDLGYINHLVGKWHLGSYKKDYLPLNRGFDTHIGFWTGRIDMYDHTSVESGTWGFDFRRGYEVAHDQFGKYVTDIFTDEAVKVINNHNSSDPMFLTIAHSAVHSGNPNEPIRAPDTLIENFTYIENFQRRKYAAVLTKLDESVGKVVKALYKKGLLENTILLFTTDNGGPAGGFNDNAATNYPLRGVKNTLWEGGIRGAGVLWSPLLKKRSRLATQRMHIVDWLPTLITAIGGNTSALPNIDGIDLWSALSNDLPSHRNLVIHNIDDEILGDSIYGSASLTIDQWKVLKGTNYKGAWDSWYGPDGRSGVYDMNNVFNSDAGQVMKNLNMIPDPDKINTLRSSATLNCGDAPLKVCNPLSSPCLFNIVEDPCEKNNMAESNPETLQKLLGIMNEERSKVLPSTHRPLDRRGDPKLWGRVFVNFGDYTTNTCI